MYSTSSLYTTALFSFTQFNHLVLKNDTLLTCSLVVMLPFIPNSPLTCTVLQMFRMTPNLALSMVANGHCDYDCQAIDGPIYCASFLLLFLVL